MTKHPRPLRGCRLEAQQAREQLQARVTVLEGRVRFLEAGFELGPPPPRQQLLLEGGSAQSAGGHWSQPAGAPRVPPAQPAALAWGGAATRQAAACLPVQHGLGVPAAAPGLERQARSNPLFDSEPSSLLLTPHQPLAAQPGLSPASCSGPGGAAGCQGGTAAQASGCATMSGAAAGQQRMAAAVARAGAEALPALTERQYRSTTELIAGMQARFLEAEGFLLSLHRL